MYFKKRKLLAVLMTLCMLFGMTDITVSAEEGSEFQDKDEEFSSVNLMRMGDPVDNGIIYVGGTASESPDGSSDAPFLTLKQAADAINADSDGGSYQIILQGNTTESEIILFGDGLAAYDITITNSVTGGAVQVTKAFTEDLIVVNDYVSLTLQGCSDTQELIFDGGGSAYPGPTASLFCIRTDATLYLKDHTVVQNIMPDKSLKLGAGIFNYGTLVVNGGTIRNNTYAIINLGLFTLSGNAYIPEGTDNNTIYLSDGRSITLSSGLELSNDNSMVITLGNYLGSINSSVLGGEIGAVYDNYDHFKLADSQYGISYAGKVVAIKFFYVDEGYTGGDSDGSIDKPFIDLSDAVSGIATIGKIYICSNLEMTNPVDIMSGTKDITIVNNGGTAHTITYSGPYRMISILGGTLSLGSKESGDDNNPSLILHCNNTTGFIYNADRLNLYPGVKLEGNVNPDTVSSGVYNDGQFNMYGGIITGNTGDYTGGVINFNTFFMEGGIISNCTGVMGGGVCNYYEAIFTMNGGRIESCTGGSIYCGGTTHISGNVSIPAGSGNNNDVIIEYGNSIIIDSNLSNTDQIQLTTVDPAPGNQVLSGTNEILLNNYQKFKYGNSTYEINSMGKIALLLNSTMVSRKNADQLYYTGSEVKPPVNVKYGVVYLTEGTDYTVSYSNNINAGTAAAVIEGLGNYAGSVSVPFTINKAVVQSIGTSAPADQTFLASEGMTLDELRASIALSNVTVNINQGTVSLPITWAVSGGAYSPKGGTYTFTGSLTGNDNVDTNSKTLSAKITVTPVTLDKPVFGATSVTEGTNTKAAAADLGSSVLPTAGTVVTAGTSVNYTITWDGSTLNMATPGASNTFTGTITYTDAPAWATLPTDLNVTRKVSVTAKPTPIPTPITPVIPPDIPAATITPTPEVTPELTPSPSGAAEDINADVTVTVGQDQQNHELNASVTVLEESINSQTDTEDTLGQITVTIPIISEEIADSLQDESITGVNIAVTVPDSITGNDNIAGCHIQLDADIIEAAKETGKDVHISVKDEEGKERYSWSFEGDDLAASDNEVTDLNLSLEIEKAEDNQELSDLLGQGGQAGGDSTGSNSLVLNFGHHGELPAQASIRIYVGDMGYSAGERVYLYYYNPETGKLDTLPYSSDYIVDSEGYITVNITHCSDYVLLPQKAPADMITALRDQISVTPDKAVLYTGTKAYSTAAISIKLPDTLELVSDLKDKTSGSAVGAVTVTYQSGNPKVAAVDSSGRIIAVGIGKTTIKVTAVLYSGKSRTFKIPVTVMKPYITITVNTVAMKVGESFTFTAQAYGLDISDIEWTTTQKSVVIIDKKTGKAKAVKKGTDYVVASIGDISCKIKITVN